MVCDGVSIGSNDLTQLILGVDRDSDVCADLFDESDPAVLQAISQIVQIARAHGITLSLCGQAPSTDPAFAEHLVRRGITSVVGEPGRGAGDAPGDSRCGTSTVVGVRAGTRRAAGSLGWLPNIH